ncbi:MAG: hypothetical protein V3G42_00740 [Oscillospiraceae bacterium]
MLKVTIENGDFVMKGTFDFGYIGTFRDSQIEIGDDLEEVRDWEIVTDSLDAVNCSDEEIAVFLTNYLNGFEAKIQQNLKQVNDNFLLRVFEDMESCGCEFWECDALIIPEKMPAHPENEIYSPNWDRITRLETAYRDMPNDGSLLKPDVEAQLRKGFPMFNFDRFIKGIIPESVCLTDGYIAFQCSDNFGKLILCAGYDELDEQLTFTDWHNF